MNVKRERNKYAKRCVFSKKKNENIEMPTNRKVLFSFFYVFQFFALHFFHSLSSCIIRIPLFVSTVYLEGTTMQINFEQITFTFALNSISRVQ